MECTVKPGFYRGANSMPRLDGPFLRSQLYVGSAPPDYRCIHLATSKAALNLPTRDLGQNPPPAPPFTKNAVLSGNRLGPYPKGLVVPANGKKAMPLPADPMEIPLEEDGLGFAGRRYEEMSNVLTRISRFNYFQYPDSSLISTSW
jgi:hypothetical protein